MRFVYLHGFASGPQSRKAQAFRAALEAAGNTLEIPDLAGGDFERLTITGQLRVVADLLQGDAARLIGSSMGGYVAALYAAVHPEIERLVLLAPAFGFSTRWTEIAGPQGMERWRASGSLDIYHYGDRAIRRLHYGLVEDALRFPAYPDFPQPARIFHGIDDTVVPIDFSRTFTAEHPQTTLTELASGHELLNVLDAITAEALPFLIG